MTFETEKVDFKKTEKKFYYPKKVEAIMVPEMTYLTVSGAGEPAGETFQKAIASLYPVAYTISMSYKKEDCKIPNFYRFVVPPLEGLWTSKTVPKKGEPLKKEDFVWKIMLRMPEFVTKEVVEWAKEEAERKKKQDFSHVKYEKIEDGFCVQALHKGSFDEEAHTFAQMEEFAAAEGLQLIHKAYHHREIYLSDFRKTAPEKLKTVLRQYARTKEEDKI
ncbi:MULTISPECIES: GyrI-like domain-containing protein [Lactococcus]|uniref:GyrI-like domain-containing protein n=1 Tax=Lactococcus TaxID=1357 RepID=UPI00203D56A9|nr:MULTISPECIES: GyrI-like domain-containing protein [Lactococcus]